jgi:hypothetical protein
MYNVDKAVERRKEVKALQEAIAKQYGSAPTDSLGELEVVRGQSQLRRKRGNK